MIVIIIIIMIMIGQTRLAHAMGHELFDAVQIGTHICIYIYIYIYAYVYMYI